MKKLSDIEKDVEKNEKRLSDITYELDGIHRVSKILKYFTTTL